MGAKRERFHDRSAPPSVLAFHRKRKGAREHFASCRCSLPARTVANRRRNGDHGVHQRHVIQDGRVLGTDLEKQHELYDRDEGRDVSARWQKIRMCCPTDAIQMGEQRKTATSRSGVFTYYYPPLERSTRSLRMGM